MNEQDPRKKGGLKMRSSDMWTKVGVACMAKTIMMTVVGVVWMGWIGVTPAAAAPRSYAVVVGINVYRYADPTLRFHNLHWSVRDAKQMVRSLVLYGFSRRGMRVLVDRQATKQNVIGALLWLKRKARPGDRVLLYFSGHGARIPVPGYVGAIDDSTPLEASLIMHDTQIQQFDSHLRGSWLRTWLGSLRTRRVILLFDSCHSGGVIERSARTSGPPCSGKGRMRFVPLPVAADSRGISRSGGEQARDIEVKVRLWVSRSEAYVAMMAAKFSQYACESSDLRGGVFTVLLRSALARLRNVRSATFATLFDSMRREFSTDKKLRPYQKDQTLLMRGAGDRPNMYRVVSRLPRLGRKIRVCHREVPGLCASLWISPYQDVKRRPHGVFRVGAYARVYYQVTRRARIELWSQSSEGQTVRLLPKIGSWSVVEPMRIHRYPVPDRQVFQAKGPAGMVKIWLVVHPGTEGTARASLEEVELPKVERPLRVEQTIKVKE